MHPERKQSGFYTHKRRQMPLNWNICSNTIPWLKRERPIISLPVHSMILLANIRRSQLTSSKSMQRSLNAMDIRTRRERPRRVDSVYDRNLGSKISLGNRLQQEGMRHLHYIFNKSLVLLPTYFVRIHSDLLALYQGTCSCDQKYISIVTVILLLLKFNNISSLI